MISEYDVKNLSNILKGEGDWYTAHVLRFLDKVLFKADKDNSAVLFRAFPEECKLIYRSYGWDEEEINLRILNGNY